MHEMYCAFLLVTFSCQSAGESVLTDEKTEQL